MVIGALLSFAGPAGWYVFEHMFSDSTVPSNMHPYFYAELITLFSFTLFGLILGYFADKTETASLCDGLTGAYSRHYVLLKLDELMKMNRQHGRNFSLILFDLDNFSQVNEKHGLLVGDSLLAIFADLAKKKKAKTDIFGRIEKDLFMLICPDTVIKEAEKKARIIGTAVTKLTEKALGFPESQTVSAGVYELPPGLKMSIEELLRFLKKPLVDAKVQGGNRIILLAKDEDAAL